VIPLSHFRGSTVEKVVGTEGVDISEELLGELGILELIAAQPFDKMPSRATTGHCGFA
jgi:hypothetical protein